MKAIECQFDASTDIDTMMLTALSSITTQDCINWIEDCELYEM